MTNQPISLPSGRVIAGQYQLIHLLGEGAMGSVYRAKQLSLGREVAIKMLRKSPTSNVKDLKRLQREAELLMQLSHPNLVHLYDADLEHTPPFLVMQLVDGASLEAYILSAPLPSTSADVKIATDLASALQHVHKAGITHRDIKPANVLLDSDKTALLADFGLARTREASKLTSTGFIMGTPAYLAPEQITRGAFGPSSDVYQLGLVLYEFFARELFFTMEAGSIRDILAQRLEGTTPDLHTAAPHVHPDAAAAVMSCLHPQPESRPSASALYSSLSSLAGKLESPPASATIRRSLPKHRTKEAQPKPASKALPPTVSSAPKVIYVSLTFSVLLLVSIVGLAFRSVSPNSPTGELRPASNELAASVPDVSLESVDYAHETTSRTLHISWKLSSPVSVGCRSSNGAQTETQTPSYYGNVDLDYDVNRSFRIVVTLRGGGDGPVITSEDFSAYLLQQGESLTANLRRFWSHPNMSDQAFVNTLRAKIGARGVSHGNRDAVLMDVRSFLRSSSLPFDETVRFLPVAGLFFDSESISIESKLALYRELSALQLGDAVCDSYGIGLPFKRRISDSTGRLFHLESAPDPSQTDNYVARDFQFKKIFQLPGSIPLPDRPNVSTAFVGAVYKLESEAVLKFELNGFPLYFSRIPKQYFTETLKLPSKLTGMHGKHIPDYNDEFSSLSSATQGMSIPAILAPGQQARVHLSAIWLHPPNMFENNNVWIVWIGFPRDQAR